MSRIRRKFRCAFTVGRITECDEITHCVVHRFLLNYTKILALMVFFKCPVSEQNFDAFLLSEGLLTTIRIVFMSHIDFYGTVPNILVHCVFF